MLQRRVFDFTEEEYDAVMADAWEGYEQWRAQLDADPAELERLERKAWRGSRQFGDILIKRACEHRACSHFRCGRGLRVGGFEL